MPKVNKGSKAKAESNGKYEEIDLALKKERLEWMLTNLLSVPDEWVAADAVGGEEQRELRCEPCEDFKKLIAAWKKAMKWTGGLEAALICMLSSCLSTMVQGDQLWFKILGPASCGKTTLAEALAVAKRYVVAKSTLRGFLSGSMTDGRDNSLITVLMNKTFITKDGDTLLQAPNLKQILSEGRDIYDRVSRSSYRNLAASRDYEGLNMTWLLCGTSSLRAIDNSELGERFLDCVIMDHIDDELEDEILWRKVNQADREMGLEVTNAADSRYAPELREAMMLTGGFVEWLRKESAEKYKSVKFPDWAKRKCARFAKYVAFLRARPSLHQKEDAERELGARLASQHARLAKSSAVIMNKTAVDDDCVNLTRKVALDTSRGISQEVVHVLYEDSPHGSPVKRIELLSGFQFGEVRKILHFMRKIGAVEPYVHKWRTKQGNEMKQQARWRLTPLMMKLYEDVHEIEG